jgi:hypothetical protein
LLTSTLFIKTVHKLLTSRIKIVGYKLYGDLLLGGVEIKVDITTKTQKSVRELGLASLSQTTKISEHS